MKTENVDRPSNERSIAKEAIEMLDRAGFAIAGFGQPEFAQAVGKHVNRLERELAQVEWGGVEKLLQQRNDALAEVERLRQDVQSYEAALRGEQGVMLEDGTSWIGQPFETTGELEQLRQLAQIVRENRNLAYDGTAARALVFSMDNRLAQKASADYHGIGCAKLAGGEAKELLRAENVQLRNWFDDAEQHVKLLQGRHIKRGLSPAVAKSMARFWARVAEDAETKAAGGRGYCGDD